MAQAFPHSRFIGFDNHAPSIEQARKSAAQSGVDGQVEFAVACGREFPGDGYDLITTFDCLHDMGDPVGAAVRAKGALKSDGTWMIVEPYAGDAVEDNLNPVGRLFYCASVLLCTPGAIAQNGDTVLGGQAGEARLREVVLQGGFSSFRRVAETPVNIVYEALP